MAVLILWASSIQWPLLAWRTKRAVYLHYAQSPGLCPVIFRGIYYCRGHRWFTLEKLFLPCHHMGCPCLIPIGSSSTLAELDHKYMWSNNAILSKHGLERHLKWRLAQLMDGPSCVHDGICKLPSSLTLSEQQSHRRAVTKENLPWDGAEAAWTVVVSECQPLERLDLWLLFPLVDDVSKEGSETISWSKLISISYKSMERKQSLFLAMSYTWKLCVAFLDQSI